MYKVECSKCGGNGIIGAYKHILGGTCFSCNGVGYKTQKTKPQKSIKFAVAIKFPGEDTVFPCYWINAKSEKEAIKKAIKRSGEKFQFLKSEQEYRGTVAA